MTNQFIFGAMAGIALGVFVAVIVMVLTLKRTIDDLCDGQSKLFNLTHSIFTNSLNMLNMHVTELTEIDSDITKYNHEFRQQILDLVEKDHVQHQSMAEEYIRMTQHCVDMVASIEKAQDDRSALEDERWEMIKDYILADEEEGDICDSCMYGDTNPMVEPCYSCKFNYKDIPTHLEEKTENDQ